jgi:hypothetical protein
MPGGAVSATRLGLTRREALSKLEHSMEFSELGPDEAACRPGDRWALLVEWACDDPALAFPLGVGVNRSEGVEVFSCTTVGATGFPVKGARRHRVLLEVPRLPLVKGDFDVDAHLAAENGLHVYDRDRLSPGFSVRSEQYSFGLVQVEHAFTIEAVSAADRRAAS